jgi:hypothetical protein
MPRTIEIDYATTYETGTTQLYDLGQRAETEDGSIFRYAKMGATVGVANKIYQGPAAVSDWEDTEHTTALVVGDTQISHLTDSTTFAIDEAKGGHIVVESAADLGHIYRIKSNAITAGGVTVMQLEDGVTVQQAVPVAGGNHLSFVKNVWNGVLIGVAGINTAANAGVPRVIIAANAFGWLQTRGPCGCLVDSDAQAVLVGNAVRNGSAAAGAVSLLDETAAKIDYGHVGYCMFTAADAGFAAIYLQID